MTRVRIEGSETWSEQWFVIVETVLLSIAVLFGVFGNLLTLLTVSIAKQIRTVPNVYVASLACANLLVSAIAAPYFIVTIWTASLPVGCRDMAYVTLVLLTITLYNHAAISINRYIMVTKSKKLYMNLYKSWKTSVSLIFIWLLPGALYAVPYFKIFGSYGYDRHREMCLFEEQEYQEKTYWYIISSDIVGPVLIFFITMVCHLKIMYHFHQSRQRLTKKFGTFDDNSAGGSSNTGTGGTSNSVYPYMGSTGQFSHQNCSTMGGLNPSSNLVIRNKRPEQHTASIVKNLVLPWLFLLLLRLPLVIVHVLDYSDRVPAIFHHICLTLVLLNPLVDFVIYALLNRQMRQYIKVMLKCRSPNTVRYIPH